MSTPPVASPSPPGAVPGASDPAPRTWQITQRSTAISLHASFLLLAVAVLLAAAILYIDSNGHVATPWGSGSGGLPPLCMYQRLFGMNCPGCGLTRCFVSAAHGNWSQAWMFHPVGLLLFGIAVAQIPYRSWQIIRLLRGREEISTLLWAPWLAGILAALLLGQWIVRMIM